MPDGILRICTTADLDYGRQLAEIQAENARWEAREVAMPTWSWEEMRAIYGAPEEEEDGSLCETE